MLQAAGLLLPAVYGVVPPPQTEPLLPRWTPTYNMSESTVVMPCNFSGTHASDAVRHRRRLAGSARLGSATTVRRLLLTSDPGPARRVAQGCTTSRCIQSSQGSDWCASACRACRRKSL